MDAKRYHVGLDSAAKAGVCLLLTVAGASVFGKDASDGLVGWWRVERKANDTVFAAADLKDHVHAGTTAEAVNHATEDGTYPAYPICHTNVNLVYPMGSGTIPNAPCIHFLQPTNYDASGTCYLNRQRIVMPADKIDLAGKPFTCIARIYPEKAVVPGSPTIFAYDYSWGNNTGFRFFLSPQSGGTSATWAYPAMYIGNKNTTASSEKEWGQIGGGANFWLDMGVAVEPNQPETGKTRIIFYLCRGIGHVNTGGNGNRTLVQTNTVANIASSTSLATRKMCIGDLEGSNSYEAKPSTVNSFRGLMHEVKLYDRALTKEEFEQACAPSTDPLFTVGTKNGSTEEFSDGDAVAVYDPATMPWCNMRRNLTAANPSVSIKTTLAAVDREIPRILEFTPIYSEDCPQDAAIDVLINGTKIRTVARGAGADRLVYISSAHLANLVTLADGGYPLTLTLQRSGGMGGTMGFDRISLGGGWQLGVRDTDPGYSEFHVWDDSTYYNFYRYYLARDNIKLLSAQLYSSSASQRSQSLYFSISDALAARGSFVFKTRSGGSGTIDYYLNGALLCSRTAVNRMDYEIELPCGTLKGGVNELRAYLAEQTTSGAFSFDYYRLTPKRLPEGMAFVVR